MGTRLLLLISSAFAIVPFIDAHAANIRMDTIPSIKVEEGWHSNVYNTSNNEVSSFDTRVTPSLALKFTTQDNVMFKLSGSYERIWYYKLEARDADSNTFFLRLDSTGEIRINPVSSVTPSAYYLNTTNSFQRTLLVPSGDPLLPPVSITNYGTTKSEDFGGGLAFRYLATPNFSVGLSGNYGEQRFSNNSNSTPGTGLTDSTTAGGDVILSYLFTPQTSAGLYLSGSHQTYVNNPNSDIFSAGIQFGHRFSPAFNMDSRFGISNVRQGASSQGPSRNTSSPTGSLNLTYSSGTVTATAFGSYVYTGGSGYGQASRQFTAGLGISDHFAREWSGNLAGNYQKSKSISGSNAVDIETTHGAAGLQYKPWEWGSLDITGTINRQISHGQFGNTLTNYTALLGITIGKTYNIF